MQSFTSAKIYERTCERGQKGMGEFDQGTDPLKSREIKGRLGASILDCSIARPPGGPGAKSPSEESGVLTSLPK